MNTDGQWNQGGAYPYAQDGYVQAENAYPYTENDGVIHSNENVPINDMQYTDYGGGESYPTANIVTTDVFISGPRELTHIPGERDYHWQFIRRHLQQVKPFSAGTHWKVVNSMKLNVKNVISFIWSIHIIVREWSACCLGYIPSTVLRSIQCVRHTFASSRIHASNL